MTSVADPLRPAPPPATSFGRWLSRAFDRRLPPVSEMDAHMLKDIGAEGLAARTRARRRRWDPPSHWIA